jgi:hypothetical protein
MITGKTPYKSDTATGLLTKMMTEPPVPMSVHVSTVDPRIEQIVVHAMAKEKANRYQTAGEMRQAIREVLDSVSGSGLEGTMPPVPTQPGLGTIPPQGSGDVPRRGFEITRRPHAQPGVLEQSMSPQGTQPPPGVDPAGQSARMHTTRPPHGASPFQTLTGNGTSWGATSTIHPTSMLGRKPRRPSKTIIAVLISIAAIAGGIAYAKMRKPDPMPRLEEIIAQGAYGSAEAYIFAHYEELEPRADVPALTKRILEMRRRDEQYEKRLNVTFDPSHRLSASTWRGTALYPEQKTTFMFTLAFERVGEATLEGYFDWPDQGVRAAVRGLHDGNQIVFTDYKLIAGSGPYAKGYLLNDKQNVFIVNDKLVFAPGTHGEHMDASLSN